MRIEAYIEQEVIRAAEKAGWYVRKVKWIGRRDAPDRLFAKNGRCVWVEFKSPGEDARTSQSREHDEMRAAGMEVVVIDTIERGLRVLGVSR